MIISLLSLLFPSAFEVRRDRNGDAHPNSDWKLRGLLCVITGALVAFIHDGNFIINTIRYTATSICFFASVFPYWINYIHLKNKVTTYCHDHIYIQFEKLTRKEIIYHVSNHLSLTAWPDRVVWWRQLGGRVRSIINCIILITGLIIYFI